MTTEEARYWGAMADAIRAEMVRNDRMTQSELAAKIGVDRGTLNKYLNGKSPMDFLALRRVAHALGVSLHDLLDEANRLLGSSQRGPAPDPGHGE